MTNRDGESNRPLAATEEAGLDAVVRALASAPARATDPTALLHYRIVAKLGQGGMGAVYKAADTRLDRFVAIKQVTRPSDGDPSSRRRLREEARAASGLAHPGIVTIHAIEEVDGVDYLVMELVEGRSLDAVLAEGPLDVAAAAAIGADVADALAHAHAGGIVHRDVKPANIMLTAQRRVKVLDFGIAKRVGGVEDAGLTASGALVGTVPYMAPEQLRRGPIDGRTDVFALGCVLYELVTGRRAFPGEDVAGVIQQILAIDPPPPSRHVPSIGPAFDAIVLGALAKDPARRTQSAAALASALRSLDAGPASLVGVGSHHAAAALLVGRARELERADQRFSAALAGAGSILLITAEAGMGKTALAQAIVERAGAAAPETLVVRGRCIEQFGAGEAYLPLLDMLEALTNGPHAELVRETMVRLAPTWSLQLPSMAHDPRLTRDAIGATRERMVRELGDLLAALSQRAPCLVLLEDVHWSDPSTLDVLRHLAHRVPRLRALVLVTLRPEAEGAALAVFAEWRAKQLATELRPGPLTVEDVAAWIDRKLAPNDLPSAVAEAVHARSEGHALFVGGLLDHLLGTDAITADARGYHASRFDPATLQWPDDLQAMLRARLDALDPDDRALIEAAAVQGREALAVVVADATGVDEVAVEERLARIARRTRLLRSVGEEELPDGAVTARFRFTHALHRDVVAAAITGKRRTSLHLRTGDSLCRRHGDMPRLAAAIAVHFEQGRDFARATAHRLAAGDHAMQLLASVEAEAHYARAAANAERLADGERTPALLDIHRRRAVALTAQGRYDAAEQSLRTALALAGGASPATAGALHVALADVLLAAHRIDAAAPHVAAALARAEQEPALAADAWGMRALAQLIVGELAGCRAALDRIESPGPLALHLGGLLHYFASEYAPAEAAFALAAARNEEALADGLLLMESRMFGALAAANLGRLGEARQVLEATAQLAARNESAGMLARLGNSLGWVRRELGDVAGAIEDDRRAAAVGRDAGETEAEANSLVNLSEDRLASGAPAEASTTFARVRALADADAWLRWRYLLRLQASHARERLAHDAVDEATEAASALLAQAESQGAGKYVIVAHELMARSALARGDRASARRALDAARRQRARTPVPILDWKLDAFEADAFDDAARRAEAARSVEAIVGALSDEDRRTFLARADVRSVLGSDAGTR